MDRQWESGDALGSELLGGQTSGPAGEQAFDSGGGTIVSVRPRQVAVLCLEVAHPAYLNRIEK